VKGEDLSGSMDWGATYTDVPGGTANWKFTGGVNYNDKNGDAAIVISKADATVTVNGYTGVYDGNAHGATLVAATGVKGEDLSGSVNLGASFTNVPGGTANWVFTDVTGNYKDQSGTAAIVITQASTSTSVSTSKTPTVGGESVTFTAAVSITPPGAGTLTGNVEFFDGSTSLGTAPVTAPTKSTSALSVGSHTIKATYLGDANFQGSTSSVITQVVNYKFTGFTSPVDMPPVVNAANGGQAIPLKWHLSGASGTAVSDPKSFTNVYSYPVNCKEFGDAQVDGIPPESYPGNSGLIYNGNGDWQFNWKTLKSYSGGMCRDMYIQFSDGSRSPEARFKFK
jgi:hypothetical protein